MTSSIQPEVHNAVIGGGPTQCNW